jgi:hypothetical protein
MAAVRGLVNRELGGSGTYTGLRRAPETGRSLSEGSWRPRVHLLELLIVVALIGIIARWRSPSSAPPEGRGGGSRRTSISSGLSLISTSPMGSIPRLSGSGGCGVYLQDTGDPLTGRRKAGSLKPSPRKKGKRPEGL